MLYFTADLHLFHKNIINLNPLKRRPGFEEEILKNLFNLLKGEDVLYVVGDFIWQLREDFLARWRSIPGRKVLVKGNHDWWFDEGELSPFFDEIYDFSCLLEVGGKRLLLCHFPSLDLRTYRYKELQERVTGEFREKGADILIHGHVHWNPYCIFCGCHLNCVKCINVNTEFHNFKPVSFKELPIW
jgi:calcineurin-like phosphoesterase family protein